MDTATVKCPVCEQEFGVKNPTKGLPKHTDTSTNSPCKGDGRVGEPIDELLLRVK